MTTGLTEEPLDPIATESSRGLAMDSILSMDPSSLTPFVDNAVLGIVYTRIFTHCPRELSVLYCLQYSTTRAVNSVPNHLVNQSNLTQ